MIRLTTANLFFNGEFFIRLGAVISAAITTWFIYLSGKKLNNEYTGYLAAIIYTATLYGSIIAGTFILPDSPQMVFWSAGLYLLIKICRYNHINGINKKNLLLFGLVAGLGMLCKVHTVFLWVGLLLYLIRHNRRWFTEPALYIAGAISIALFLPVIKWNIDNHFVTYLYHSKRVTLTNSTFDFNSFFSFTGGQIFYMNPIVFFLILLATAASFKNNLPVSVSQKRILLYCSLPLIIMATVISLFKNTLPHWTGPAYTGLILLTACYLSKHASQPGRLKLKPAFEKVIMPGVLMAACLFQLVIVTAGIWLINFMPGTLGKKEKLYLGEGDFTLDMYGWRSLEKQFKKITTSDIASGALNKNACIISNKWFPASHIDYYVAIPLQRELIAIGDTNEIHQYAWINRERKKMKPGDDAWCIVPSNNYTDVQMQYAAYFDTIRLSKVIEQKRNEKVCRYFYIWQLKNFTAKQNLRE